MSIAFTNCTTTNRGVTMLDVLLLTAAISCIIANIVIITRIVFINSQIRRVERMIKRNGDPELCCCGDVLANHGYGTGHGFVSQDDHFRKMALAGLKI